MCVGDDGTITGLFDLSDAGIDAAAQELSHLHSLGSRFAAIALNAYGPIDVEDVVRAHPSVGARPLALARTGNPAT